MLKIYTTRPAPQKTILIPIYQIWNLSNQCLMTSIISWRPSKAPLRMCSIDSILMLTSILLHIPISLIPLTSSSTPTNPMSQKQKASSMVSTMLFDLSTRRNSSPPPKPSIVFLISMIKLEKVWINCVTCKKVKKAKFRVLGMFTRITWRMFRNWLQVT